MKEVKAAEALSTRVGVKLFALVMALVLALSMTTAPVSAYAANTSDDGKVTVEKTASGLDENDQTDVTLKIGGEQDVNNVAVLFVLDYSTSVEVRNEAAKFLEELATKSNTNVKACVINYWSDADTGEWTTITSDTDTDELLAQTQTGGTNYHAGLLAAQEALASDEIAGYETYLITISDGLTYLWTGDDGVTTQSVWYQNVGNGETDIQNGNDVYNMKYGNEAIPEEFFGELVAGSARVVSLYENTVPYFESYGTTKPDASETERYLSFENEETANNYLIGTEIAIYKTASVWSSLVASVDYAYAFELDENHWDTYPYGKQLMDWMISIADNDSENENLNGEISADTAAATFATISNQIIYTINSGTVTDVIGSDFDLAGLDTFTLTVGETTYEGTVDESANTVTFDGGNYVVTYYPDGENGEYFTWEINVPVESANPVQLTYTLTLVNKSETAGEYTVPTNESAELEYEGTDGKTGTVDFPVPEVTYTVEEAETPTTTDPGDDEGTTSESTSSDTQTDTSTGTLPKTGDSSLSLVVGLTALALASLAAVIFALVRLRATKLTDMLTRH